eukprot:CAMPEP_0198203174 /NCGR_PEP_ID=MMETSP1445-20131203/6421_1 /TAXON_ID=36898 /ORGANISM="Pyramimonas sp., Strain CCMP2087" /LENGTH=68 /DNA_ID=CAMNT_0043874435 /DNA_START=146 /DNA_END=352 /DNA_ORIENTATION=-
MFDCFVVDLLQECLQRHWAGMVLHRSPTFKQRNVDHAVIHHRCGWPRSDPKELLSILCLNMVALRVAA